MRNKKYLLAVVLVLCSCLLFAACGKKDSSVGTPGEPPVGDEPVAEEPLEEEPVEEEVRVFLGGAAWGKDGEYEIQDMAEEGWEEDRALAEELNEVNGDRGPDGLFDVEKAEKVVELVNQARKQKGLRELKLDLEIVGAAEIRAEEQRTLYSHSRPDGSAFWTIFDECNIAAYAVGENLASGSPCKPEQVVKAWINSPAHAENLFSPEYTRIGVGYYLCGGYGYWAQLFAG